jgi:hypothetical protein
LEKKKEEKRRGLFKMLTVRKIKPQEFFFQQELDQDGKTCFFVGNLNKIIGEIKSEKENAQRR